MHPFHVLGFLQTAFMIWMLVDAVKRRVEFYWYIIIFFPFGEWVYFFAVKIHDFRQVRFRLAERAPSLRKLRFEAKQTPSINNKLALADWSLRLRPSAGPRGNSACKNGRLHSYGLGRR